MNPVPLPPDNPEIVWCPACRTLLLVRVDYDSFLDVYQFDEQYECPSCHHSAHYIPSESPGQWRPHEKKGY